MLFRLVVLESQAAEIRSAQCESMNDDTMNGSCGYPRKHHTYTFTLTLIGVFTVVLFSVAHENRALQRNQWCPLRVVVTVG